MSMRKLINIAESSSYDQRVQEVVDRVIRKHEYYPLQNKEEIMRVIKSAAGDMIDYRAGGRAQKDFISDVISGLKGKLKRPKADPAKNQEKLQRIAVKINDAIGSTFPDGDPFDFLMPWMRKQGYREEQVMRLLDKAARLNGYKSYHKQLESSWDEIAADNPDLVSKDDNPWR